MIKKYIYSSFQKRLKFYKIIFIFIVFVSCTAFLLLYINKLKIQINLKTLENKEIERNRLILIEKIQINKMRELIHACKPNYFLGFYRINLSKQEYTTIEIIGDSNNPEKSLRYFNNDLFQTIIFSNETLKKINLIEKNYIYFLPNDEYLYEVVKLVTKSKNFINKIGIVIIKNQNNIPVYAYSLTRTEKDTKPYTCSNQDMSEILKKLSNNLEGYL
jgi:hypothetical protein